MTKLTDRCVHDDSRLEVVDAELNAEKAGRLRCPECNCTFMDGEVATRGAECPAFGPTPAPVEDEVVEDEVEEPNAKPKRAAKARRRAVKPKPEAEPKPEPEAEVEPDTSYTSAGSTYGISTVAEEDAPPPWARGV